eukprot:10369611-Heterocapsa_arctica.AAC.1
MWRWREVSGFGGMMGVTPSRTKFRVSLATWQARGTRGRQRSSMSCNCQRRRAPQSRPGQC